MDKFTPPHIREKHSNRPNGLRKGKSWKCKCKTINLWENSECKMILTERQRYEAAIEKNRQKESGIETPKPKRERFIHDKHEREQRAELLEIFTNRPDDYDDFGNPK